uniref:type II toxin-antitoxin system RelE/ParE family toxin n=1 Tax=Photorhabdus sp. RM322S TaxID=3342825 RepID=UPI0036DB414E
MRIFATDDFSVFMEDNLLTNKDICQSAREIIGGLVDANLGGNLFKKRIAFGRVGKSGSARSVVAFRYHDKMISIGGWLKKNVAKLGKEIPDNLLKMYKLLAKDLLNISDKNIEDNLLYGLLIEVICDE